MIGKLKGTLISIESNVGLIETSGGVSYQCFMTPEIIQNFKLNSPIELFTYLQVRDDALILFSFLSKSDLALYTLLLSVSGVGPKTAYSVISHVKGSDLIEAIKDNDISYFTRIPGLGKKTGMKIILELSQKLHEKFSLEKMYLSPDDKTVVDALVSLGFSTDESRKIFQQLPKNLSLEDKIRAGIKLGTKS